MVISVTQVAVLHVRGYVNVLLLHFFEREFAAKVFAPKRALHAVQPHKVVRRSGNNIRQNSIGIRFGSFVSILSFAGSCSGYTNDLDDGIFDVRVAEEGKR